MSPTKNIINAAASSFASQRLLLGRSSRRIASSARTSSSFSPQSSPYYHATTSLGPPTTSSFRHQGRRSYHSHDRRQRIVNQAWPQSSSSASFSNQADKKNDKLDDDLLLVEDDDSDYDDYSDDDDDDDDDDHQKDQPWKTLLDMPSRAVWRASDPYPPDHVIKAQTGVLSAGGATAKQLRRTYVNVIIAAHRQLAERRERERRRLINRTQYSRRAQQRDDDEGQPVLYGKLETLAQLRNRLHPNYAITKRVLEEVKSLLGHSLYTSTPSTSTSTSSDEEGNHNTTTKTGWRPKRIIDMGIGVGSASAAALEVFENDVEWVHGIDPSRCMRECAKELLEEIMEHDPTSTASSSSSSDNQQQQQPPIRFNPPRLTLSGSISADTSSKSKESTSTSTFDMALMTYTATELPGVSATLAAAAILWQKLGPNGVFIMIEPGTPDGFNSIRSVRSMLLDVCPPPDATQDVDGNERKQQADECHIIAPCTHNGTCPMERYQHDFFKQQNPKTQMDVKSKSMPTSSSSSSSSTMDDFDFNDVDEDVDNWGDDEWEDGDEDGNAPGKNRRGPGMTEETDFLSRRFCSFVQTMSSGSHLGKGEKFSYIVAQKRILSANDDDDSTSLSSFQDDRLRDLLTSVYHANEKSGTGGTDEANDKSREQVQALFDEAQALETKYLESEEDDLGLEFLQGDANRASFARIIRAPLKKRGHVLIDYCAAPGRLMRTRVSKALDQSVAPGLYKAARKSRWGGLWPDVATGSLDYFKEPADKKPDK